MPNTNEELSRRIAAVIKRNIAQVTNDNRSVTIKQYDQQIIIPIIPSSAENSINDIK